MICKNCKQENQTSNDICNLCAVLEIPIGKCNQCNRFDMSVNLTILKLCSQCILNDGVVIISDFNIVNNNRNSNRNKEYTGNEISLK